MAFLAGLGRTRQRHWNERGHLKWLWCMCIFFFFSFVVSHMNTTMESHYILGILGYLSPLSHLRMMVPLAGYSSTKIWHTHLSIRHICIYSSVSAKSERRPSLHSFHISPSYCAISSTFALLYKIHHAVSASNGFSGSNNHKHSPLL